MALIASLSVMLFFLLTGCRMAQGVTAPQTAVKGAAAAPAAPSIQGKLVPRHSVSLSLADGTRVDQVFVKEGQPVSAGDVLVQLDGYEQSQARMIAAQAEELTARQAIDALHQDAETARARVEIELAQAVKEQAFAEDHFNSLAKPLPQMTIDAGRANLVLAERQLKQAQDDLTKAQRIFHNKKHIIWRFINKRQFRLRLTLLEQKAAVYERKYQDAEDRYEDLLAYPDPVDLALAQARLERANSRLAEAQRSLEELSHGPDPDDMEIAQSRLKSALANLQAAQVDLRSSQLVAPISGVVVDLQASQGEWISPGTPAVVLADFSEWLVESDKVGESLIPSIYPGERARLHLDAIPDLSMNGEIESLSQDYREEDGDIYYTIKIIPSQTDPRLRWGMTIDIELPQGGSAN